ncbi:hypothetical protein ASG60_15765 [Methylobacterium sp. Leaf469]|uniref:DUF2442 domain-containing protein n=1 Tax=Methylobacterium sp. Leaf469 TaxID=1736387 RepID=UPI0006FE40F0|nr:DUF2442 domain-containing protein [Methylobacterium sp. Leaf469]KQT86535.1 hypothetical protein ASG60_15765 [Methylobacterium sp. Leaf469]
MVDLADDAIADALERGRLARSTEPRAASASYDRQNGHVVIVLTNGCTFSFPPRLVQGLESADDDTLADIELLGAGYGLHWGDLDVDMSVPGLLAGIFGTRAFMAAHAGRATSAAKASASRANGAKGGRPRKSA